MFVNHDRLEHVSVRHAKSKKVAFLRTSVTVHSELAIPTFESEKEAYFFPWQYGARH